MFLSRRSVVHCGIARHPHIHIFPLLSAVTRRPPAGSGALYHRQRDPGILYPSLDPRPGTTHVPVPSILSVPSRLLAATTSARAWPSPFKAQGIGARHRYPCKCIVTSALLSVRRRHSNHYPYSEPDIRKVSHYCLAHHNSVVSRSFHSTLTAIGTRVPTSILLYSWLPTRNSARLEARMTGIEAPTTTATNLHSNARHNTTSGDFRCSSSHISPPRRPHVLYLF
jgi:hypothetical protein